MEESWRWTRRGGIIEETSGRHLGSTWEESGRHRLYVSDLGRHLGSIWEASGEHLGGIWEASGEHLGPSGARRHLGERTRVKIIALYCRMWRDRVFRLHGSDVTCTKYRKLQQLSLGARCRGTALDQSMGP